MKIREFNDKIQQIKDDVESVKDSVLNEAKRKEKIEEIRQRATETREELEKGMVTLKDKSKEDAQALLDSLNEIINLKLSIWEKTPWDSSPSSTDMPSTDEEKWFFWRTTDWVAEQWNAMTMDNLKKEPWKTVLRGLWFAATWVWLWVLVYKWCKKLFGREARAERKKRREERRTEREKKREERKERFWQSWFWKFLKRLWIWAAVVWWAYTVKKWIDNWKEKTPEKKLEKLRWFESNCKTLKSQADDCLRLSRTFVADHVQNKELYDKILADALSLQTQTGAIFDEISKSSASSDIKTEAENLKNNINNYVEEIKAMKDEIYATIPEDDNWGGGNWEWGSGPEPEESPEWEWTQETLKPVSSTVLTNAAMDYLDGVKNEIPVGIPSKTWNWIKDKARIVLSNYFSKHPILKKSKSKRMIFEIDDVTAFWNMIKEMFNKIIPTSIMAFLPKSFKESIKDINKTLKESDAKTYEDIVFQHFWSLITNAVRAENWTMTVQSYYDGISKAYPNKNAIKVANDLASSWQANKDIKDMKYPFA